MRRKEEEEGRKVEEESEEKEKQSRRCCRRRRMSLSLERRSLALCCLPRCAFCLSLRFTNVDGLLSGRLVSHGEAQGVARGEPLDRIDLRGRRRRLELTFQCRRFLFLRARCTLISESVQHAKQRRKRLTSRARVEKKGDELEEKGLARDV